MIKRVHVHPKVEKAIEQMAGMDNAPMIAASRARDIICQLLDGKVFDRTVLDGMGMKRTKRLAGKKDSRVKNLFKFDLGKGYRLISIREKDSIYILFIGTHDQCDRWLDDNRNKRVHMAQIPVVSHAFKPVPVPMSDSDKYFEYNMEGTCDDSINIPQTKLRTVFCGLAGF